jgi:putative transposase
MPSRYYKRVFIKGYYYHIYNRGANKEIIFKDDEDYQVFIDILAYYLTFPKGRPLSIAKNIKGNLKSKVPNLNSESSTVNLCVFCLMPNHFHLLLKQQSDPTKENSVSNLMRRVIITYAMYFQKKYDHSGTIFQGKFKNVLVDSDSQLLQLSKYIHKNPIEILGSEPLSDYKFSSYKYYISTKEYPDWLDKESILSFFSKIIPNTSYQKFVEETSTNIENDTIKRIKLEE